MCSIALLVAVGALWSSIDDPSNVGTFGSAVAAAIAIANAEADPFGPRSPEVERKTRTGALSAARHLP